MHFTQYMNVIYKWYYESVACVITYAREGQLQKQIAGIISCPPAYYLRCNVHFNKLSRCHIKFCKSLRETLIVIVQICRRSNMDLESDCNARLRLEPTFVAFLAYLRACLYGILFLHIADNF